MALHIMFSPMQLAPKEFMVGDTIRVTFRFMYTVGADTTITVQAVPYQYRMGVLDRIGSSAGRTEIRLARASEPTEQTGSVDFTLKDISPGTYGLMVEVPGTDWQAKADDVLIVKSPSRAVMDIFTGMMPMLMMLMMLGMTMPMVTGAFSEDDAV